jgi:hypothetical protein
MSLFLCRNMTHLFPEGKQHSHRIVFEEVTMLESSTPAII